MSHRVRTSVVAGCLIAVAAASGAVAQSMSSGSWTGDVVADRQRFMKLNGALWKDIQDKHKAGRVDEIAVSAEALAINSTRIPVLFPEGSLTDKSKAKPEVWQKWPEFQAAAKSLQTEAEKLRDASIAKNAQATDDLMKTFGRQACGACHTPFRVPPPQRS